MERALISNNFSPVLSLILFTIIFSVTLLIPGNAVLLVALPRKNIPVDLRIPLALALGFSLIPIILLWSSTLGFQLSAKFGWVYLGIAGLVNLLVLAASRPRWPGRLPALKKLWLRPEYRSLAWLTGIFLLAWFTRFITVHGFLVAPSSDSYNHTIITSLIAEQGRIPTSYEPYAPPSSFTYHFGFHALAAFSYWLTGIPLTKLVLWVGQGLNALVVMSMYFSVRYLTQNEKIALIAAFLVGLVAVFPAYMINWSRFTQLSSLVILALMLGLIIGWRNDRDYWRVMPILVGGIFLSHYRIFAMFVVLAGVVLLVELGTGLVFKLDLNRVKPLLWVVGIISAGLVIVLPWFIKFLLTSQLFNLMTDVYSSTTNQSGEWDSFYSLSRLEDSLQFYSNYWLLGLAGVGLIRGFAHYRKMTLVVVIWTGLMLLWSNPNWLPVPSAGLLDIVSLVMSLFVPICFLSALGVMEILAWLSKTSLAAPRKAWVWQLALTGVSLFATIQMATIAKPEGVYVRATDLRAIEWVKTHTPPEAKFLVNPIIFGWNLGAITGSDAGYWLPFLAQRETTLLPITVPNEKIDRQILEKIAVLSETALHPDSSTLSLLRREKITHIFIGEKGGGIPVQLLISSPCTREVWHEGATRIFELNYECSGGQ
jgi:hypothetical protein